MRSPFRKLSLSLLAVVAVLPKEVLSHSLNSPHTPHTHEAFDYTLVAFGLVVAFLLWAIVHWKTLFLTKAGIIATLSALVLTSLGFASHAHAHHPLGGSTPANFTEGILSGIGHPIIEADHFAFLILTGFLSYVIRSHVVFSATVAVGSLVGTLVAIMGLQILQAELIISASILFAGILILFTRKTRSLVVLSLVPAFMIFHGYAYAEAIIGAEATPTLSYLFGLTIVQFFIVCLTGLSFVLLEKVHPLLSLPKTRIFFGGTALGVGSIMLYPLLISYV